MAAYVDITDAVETAANWASNNPTPLLAQRCYESDTKRVKVGDGSTAYNSLPYSNSGTHGAEESVASASTCNIGAALSENVSITGTTTITSFGTVAAGTKKSVRFASVLTLTHNGTSLIIPGAANITTAAGDRCVAQSLGAGNWVVLAYARASGEPIRQLKHYSWAFDPKAVCDGAVDRLFLMTIGEHAPSGFVVTAWRLSFEADPTTEIDLDLKRADAFIGVANAAVMDVLDTTAGVASETTAANINSGAAVANGKVIYLEFGTAYTEANHQCVFELWGYSV